MTQAPFDEEQVRSMRAFQAEDSFHPFTCTHGCGSLTPSTDGLHCDSCGYSQTWVHPFMADWGWLPNVSPERQRQLRETHGLP